MAGYREHISVSGLLGVAYGAAATGLFGFTPVQGALAGCLTWVAGMLPDLDAESGQPVRELFGLLAAVAPMVLMRRLLGWAGDVETAMLCAFLLYAAVRYGGPLLLSRLAVHRGMFHSVPALVIAAECTFLAYQSESVWVRLMMAGAVAVGFLSHLVLDEMYAVQWTGIRLKLNNAAGSALKLVGRSLLPNLVCYGLLAALTYATLIDLGLLRPQDRSLFPPFLRQVVEESPRFLP